MRLRHYVNAVAVLSFLVIGSGILEETRAQEGVAVSATLRSVFSPRRSPTKQTMGLSQRSFLDLVEQSKPKLEVAFLIDGTESMAPALEGVRDALSQMMRDLELYKQSEIAYQIVIFRDLGSPSGEVSFPLQTEENGFTTDRKALIEAIRHLTAESGAPYFPEPVDEGVYQALNALKWSTTDDVSRWLFLFGDAPPFDSTLQDDQTGARRRYATDKLVAIADARHVHINCILCTTREEDQQAFDQVLDHTRAFMNALSTGSGGIMLDLSYRDIRDAILKANELPEVDYSPVGTIRATEVEQVRSELNAENSQARSSVGVAILPHAPLDEMSFASDALGVQVATELRLRINSIPGIVVSEPLLVERHFDQLQRNASYSGLRGSALLQALGRALGVDYVLWGDARSIHGSRIVTTRLYDAATGEVLTEAERASNSSVGTDQICSLLASDLLAASISSPAHRPLANHLAAVRNDPDELRSVTRVISSSSAHEDLVTGLGALESALAYPAGDDTGIELLNKARNSLKRAVASDETNSLPHFLLANCLYNLAKQSHESSSLIQEFGSELRAAYRYRISLPNSDLRREIEADYDLLLRGKPSEAIPVYLQLAEGGGSSDSARRANWMLAGIYGGDWGVDGEFVNADKARERLIRILALWPDSSEAQFIRRVLRWDDRQQETRFPHFPRENDALVQQIDRET